MTFISIAAHIFGLIACNIMYTLLLVNVDFIEGVLVRHSMKTFLQGK